MIGPKLFAKPTDFTDFSYFSYQPGIFSYLLYGLCIVVPTIAAVRMSFASLARAVPISVLLLLLWATASLGWSDFPMIGALRLIVAASMLLGTLVCTTSIGARKTIKIVGLFLGAVLVLDWISIFSLPSAVQLANEQVSSDVGWRGIHSHKNIAGVVAALGTLYFVSHVIVKPTWRNAGFMCLSASFLWVTYSRTSIGTAAVVSLVLLMLWLGSRSQLLAQLFRIGCLVTFIALVGAVAISQEAIVAELSDPRAFNGRGAVWLIAVDYLRNHFWLGSGFGSFWRVGVEGPALRYSLGWAGFSYNGHNGYLDVFLTMGVIGFILTIVAFAIAPAIQLSRVNRYLPEQHKLVAVAFILFGILQNLLESTFLVASSSTFIGWAIGLGIMRSAQQDQTSRLATQTP
jgi:O-antigen ligase